MAREQKIASAYLQLGVDDSRVRTDVDKIKPRVTNQMRRLATAAANALASWGIGRFVADTVNAAGRIEALRIDFEVLTGSIEKADSLLAQLRGFALVTPFDVDQLGKAAQTLLNFGVTARDVSSDIMMIGEISGGNAERFNRLALAFGQVQAKGRLMGQEVIQMTEQGFNPLKTISETTGRSMVDLYNAMERGEIAAEMVRDAMKTATSGVGRFAGRMQKFMQSFPGQMALLSSQFYELRVAIGEALLPTAKSLVRVITMLVQSFTTLPQWLQATLAVTLAMTPAILAAVAAMNLLGAAGITAAVGVRALLAATGVGVLLPLLGFIVAKLLDLAQTVEVDVMPVLDALQEPIKKFQRAWEVFSSTVMSIVRTTMITLQAAFGSFFDALGIDLAAMGDTFFSMFMYLIDVVAGFVLDAAEWFNVIVNNWDTAMSAMWKAFVLAFNIMRDILFNFFPAAWTLIKGFAMSIVDVFRNIPKAIQAIFSGGGISGALNALFTEASARFAQTTMTAFGQIAKMSPETKQAAAELQGSLAKLAAEKRKLERERDDVEKNLKKLEEPKGKGEGQPSAEAVKQEVEIKFGTTALQDFSSEVQDLFLKADADDKQAQIVDLNQAQLDVQDNVLKTNEEMRDILKNSPPIKVAT